ncbi:hypothetical protein [Burkholderia ambifaria]|uniref:hypothetical protein n=1 Tax=Burkholderia ambifaria TaxID=152480 RepID=UPI00158D5E94|nr:hypothetical protein [Burkholderia ambifaria]
MTMLLIQASITAYQGPSANLLGAYDSDTGLLIVERELARDERIDDAVFVTDDPRAEDRDRLFNEDNLQAAIRSFFRAKHSGLVELEKSVKRHDPEHKIEAEGVTEQGSKYRVNPEATNGQIAVLAMMDAVAVAGHAEAASDFADNLIDMFLTI